MRKRLLVLPIVILFLPILFIDKFLPLFYIICIIVTSVIAIEIFFMAGINFKNNWLLISTTIAFLILQYLGILILSGVFPFEINVIRPTELSLIIILLFTSKLIAINMCESKGVSFEEKGKNIMLAFFIFVYIGVGLSYVTLIRLMPHGRYLIFFVMSSAWLSDTGGYTIGKHFGKHKMITSASPNKTYEGIVGMFIFAFIFAFLFISGSKSGFLAPLLGKDILPYSNLTIYAITFIFVVTSFLGDMGESIIKRMFNKKDSGKILPGHGGTFDIFDSLIITSFVGYYIFLFI